jgi:hypothetical protein
MHTHGLYQIHEQIRYKCYFVPYLPENIEPIDIRNGNESRLTSTLNESTGVFILNEEFQSGCIRFDTQPKDSAFSSLIDYSSNDQCWYLSSNAVRQWFHTLILLNQTCAIAKRFLTGNGSHITFLVKEPIEHRTIVDK